MSEKQIEYVIQLKGKASIPTELQTNRNYMIAVEMACEEYSVKDDGGNKNIITYSMRPFGQVVIKNPEGKKIYSTMKGKKSINMRMALMRLYEKEQPDCEFEVYYDKKMDELIFEINSKNT